MARATRSAKQQDDKPKDLLTDVTNPGPARVKGASKKRKRASIAEHEDQPASKLPRNGEAVIKEEEQGESAIAENELEPLEFQGAGDVSMNSEDAQRILDILEMVDTQGLLDRVFPLPADPADSSSSPNHQQSQQQSYSFRTLLKESSRHPLRVLHSAVQHLLPVFAHPRSRPSEPAAQQLKFCNLALSLLDQSSFHTCPAALNLETIIPDRPDAVHDADENDAGSSAPSLSSANITRKHKYALMQKLPTGDWWTSLNSDFPSGIDDKELKDLSTAHAELVAILPSASTSLVPAASTSSIPTLGLYTQKPSRTKQTVPPARSISSGAFLDYGPYSSFAPTFDQEGVELGRVGLGEVLSAKEKAKRLEKAYSVQSRRTPPRDAPVTEDVEMQDSACDVQDVTAERTAGAFDEALEALLPPDQVTLIKEALGSLELEAAVQELLDRNARALRRLEELQLQRLGGLGGGSSTVEVGSEEWNVAQGIVDSLALLASFRPCSSKDSSTLIPPPSVLRKLHRTLPSEPSEGWYGTLPPTRGTALRDDSTIRIKSGVSVPASQPTPATPAAVAVPTAPTLYGGKAATPATPYGGYGYQNYASGQYRSGYAYTPGATNTYYPNAYAQSATGTAASQYTNQQYTGAGQTQYSYGSWYNYQPAAQQKPGTPQPAAALPTSYASFFNAAQPQRAVANTVTAATAGKPYTGVAWPSGTGGYAPTLPMNARPTQGTQPPGTPTPQVGGGYQYYPGYQQPQPAQTGQR
ncbi:hypothetical protein EW146_g3546 [Bondarzewia mesenterica]|uniref:Uncharacterized protein n=1 Tax=Bondarzewia mesenterica TaxID=1095465 RepID=A0A4S4LXG0_9AGAM|nr:hypothetical protein EW146_g3546 [Bondarzewia mesenterica]